MDTNFAEALVAPVYFSLICCYALLFAGIVWSEIGEGIAKRLAERNINGWALSVREGASVFVIHLFPSLYMLSLLRGRPLSRWVVLMGYVIVGALWLVGPVGFWLLSFASVLSMTAEELNASGEGGRQIWAGMSAAWAFLNALLWLFPVRSVLAFHGRNRRRIEDMRLRGVEVIPKLPLPGGYIDYFRGFARVLLLFPLLAVIGAIVVFFTTDWHF